MHWIVAAALLARAGAFVPARTPKITAVCASKDHDDDDDWRRLANSKDAAADVFLSWAAEDPGLGACLRTLNLRRGRFGGCGERCGERHARGERGGGAQMSPETHRSRHH